MPDSNKPNTSSFDRRSQYDIDGADLYIVVERTLFRVHSYFLCRESPTFKKMIDPASSGGGRKGATEKDPIVLPRDVAPENFEKLISVFYNPRYSLYQKSVEEWKSIYELADKFQFAEVKNLCVRELQKKNTTDLPLVERIALYIHLKVDPRHLVPLYAELCERNTPLTLVEAKTLGMETMLFVANAREALRAKPSDGGQSPLPNGMKPGNIFRTIEKRMNIKEGATEQFMKEHEITTTL